ncbi:hypothetical protein AZ029_004512 [Klebsiella pneumoniae]|uniref:hypothetical protein n=1 Tax=Klebsiella pneumoniae TaxID=573 RepID=UPI000A364351|nr:hypothetical protein [Klebsiella pneumoniae]OUH69242.1 hypothetical protein AZ029_004512 [Klebsiella pneumoniae]
MIDDDIEKQMSLKMKFEILARFFYYIEQDKDIPFSEINSDEQRLCYFVAVSYTHLDVYKRQPLSSGRVAPVFNSHDFSIFSKN